jgi:hypothetical protein
MTNVDTEVPAHDATTEPDAIAALVARVASAENDDEPSAASTLEDDVDDKIEPAWMADIDSRMATVKDMEVKAVNGEYTDKAKILRAMSPGNSTIYLTTAELRL